MLINGAVDSENARGVTARGSVTKFVRLSVSGTIPHSEQLVLIQPVAEFHANRDATACHARGV